VFNHLDELLAEEDVMRTMEMPLLRAIRTTSLILAEVAQLVANSTQKCVRNRGISRFFGSETGVMSM
jgi:hypothetical protein